LFLPIGSAPLLLLTPDPPETHRHRLRAVYACGSSYGRAQSRSRAAFNMAGDSARLLSIPGWFKDRSRSLHGCGGGGLPPGSGAVAWKLARNPADVSLTHSKHTSATGVGQCTPADATDSGTSRSRAGPAIRDGQYSWAPGRTSTPPWGLPGRSRSPCPPAPAGARPGSARPAAPAAGRASRAHSPPPDLARRGTGADPDVPAARPRRTASGDSPPGPVAPDAWPRAYAGPPLNAGARTGSGGAVDTRIAII